MKKIFSTIVIISLIAYAFSWIIPYFWLYLYEEQVLSVLQWHTLGSKLAAYPWINYLISVVYLITSIGLLFYQGWARTGFLWVTIVSILLSPFLGVYVGGPYEVFLGYVLGLCDGGIIAMAYLTSIANEFKKF